MNSNFMKSTLRLLLSAWACAAVFSLAAQAQIVFDRPKTEPPLDNPYTLNVAREQIIKTVEEVLKSCAMTLDAAKTKPAEGRYHTAPVVFTKGVNARTDLEHVSNPAASEARNWLRGRVALEIVVLPLDEKRSQLQVVAHIEGQVAEMTGSRWVEAPSNGRLEDEVLRGLAGKILGLDLGLKKGSARRLLTCEY
jgi:hypothetical protein